MNTDMHAKEHLEIMANTETIVTESDGLAQYGFTLDEIVSLLWLQQWYQNGGSDRVTMVRQWEFLKLLVRNPARSSLTGTCNISWNKILYTRSYEPYLNNKYGITSPPAILAMKKPMKKPRLTPPSLK